MLACLAFALQMENDCLLSTSAGSAPVRMQMHANCPDPAGSERRKKTGKFDSEAYGGKIVP